MRCYQVNNSTARQTDRQQPSLVCVVSGCQGKSPEMHSKVLTRAHSQGAYFQHLLSQQRTYYILCIFHLYAVPQYMLCIHILANVQQHLQRSHVHIVQKSPITCTCMQICSTIHTRYTMCVLLRNGVKIKTYKTVNCTGCVISMQHIQNLKKYCMVLFSLCTCIKYFVNSRNLYE